MLKLGMVGANGQVGAELCLLLAAREDIELVAICRNRSGSSFLRWQGIACRHGRVADPTDAARLLSDCDVVVNSSLASGTPVEIRRIEAQIIRNVFEYSKAAATIIHFSTQSVYGDPRPGRWIRWRNPYGRAKLTTERRVRVESRRTKKPAHIFRLGHVCGSLQEISNTIRTEVRTGTVFLPAQNCSSNTVYTAAIIGAIEQILAGKSQAGTYDLMNSPRWSWREVYEYEAGVCNLPLEAHLVDSVSDSRKFAVAAPALRMAGELVAAQPVRDLLAKVFAHMPSSMNARAMAWWYAKRARLQIAALNRSRAIPEHLSWVENGKHFFPADTPTIDLLRSLSQKQRASNASGPWPIDLPDASSRALQHTLVGGDSSVIDSR